MDDYPLARVPMIVAIPCVINDFTINRRREVCSEKLAATFHGSVKRGSSDRCLRTMGSGIDRKLDTKSLSEMIPDLPMQFSDTLHWKIRQTLRCAIAGVNYFAHKSLSRGTIPFVSDARDDSED